MQNVGLDEAQAGIKISRRSINNLRYTDWSPDANSWLVWKDPNAWKDWRQEEKGTTEDEMAGWHHWLYGCESEWTPELVMDREACDSWGRTESDMIEQLNWTDTCAKKSVISEEGLQL